MSYPTLSKHAQVVSVATLLSREELNSYNESLANLSLYNHEWSGFFNEKGQVQKLWSFKHTSIDQLLEEMTQIAKACPFLEVNLTLYSDQPNFDDNGEYLGESESQKIGYFSIQNGVATFERA